MILKVKRVGAGCNSDNHDDGDGDDDDMLVKKEDEEEDIRTPRWLRLTG